MTKSRSRHQAADPARPPFRSPELEAVIEGDRRFFRRHPDRATRVRLAARAEIEASVRAGDGLGPPMPGFRWVAVVRQVAPNARLKAWCQLAEGADLDAPEALCSNLYDQVAGSNAADIERRMREVLEGRR